MSDQVAIGDYSLEISGDEVLVRDENGAIVEEVKLDDLEGELTLPDGKKVDLASVLAGDSIETLQTAAGAANDNLGNVNGGPAVFHTLHPAGTELGGFQSAGALGGTQLTVGAFNGNEQPDEDPNRHPKGQADDHQDQSPPPQNQVQVTWSSHEPWHVAENQAGGALGKLVEGDPADFRFELSDARFEVVDGVLRVREGVSFDFESEPGIDLQLTVTSRTGEVETSSIHLDVTDVNEAQNDLTLDHTSVSESAPGAVIGTVTVTDPDGNDNQSFAVSDDRFEVVNGALKLKEGIALDHEGEASVDITVTATDQGGNQIQRTFTIQVGDINEAQTALTLDSNTVAENAVGAVIGALNIVDPDVGDGQSFQLSDDRFEIVDGLLKLKDGISLDHEGEPTVNVTITATDGANHQIQQTFAITVSDRNETPTGATLSGDTLVENVAGAVVGVLTAIDPDAADTHAFEVSDERFEVMDGQLKLKDGVSIDFEAESSLDVTVTVTDGAGNKVQETFTLSVGNANEGQTDLALDGNHVAENAAGAIVGSVSVADPDAGDSQTFQVSDDRFEIVSGQLKLKDGVSLDHESEPTVDVQVIASDLGGNQIARTFTIAVGDVNEAQTGLSVTVSPIQENVAGAVVGAVSVADPDAGDIQSFQLSDDRFEILNGQLKLKDGISLDHESEPSLDVTVTAIDGAGHEIQQTFTVGVNNVNEAPTASAKDGWVESHIVNTSTTYQPVAGSAVGAYLYSNDSAGVAKPAANLLNGVDASNLAVTGTAPLTVTFQKEAAGNHNMIGTYQHDGQGNIIPGSVKFVWLDASAGTEGKLGATMVKDFLGYSQSNTVSLGTVPAGSHVGFFAISNGANDGTNKSLLTDAAAGTNSQAAAMTAIASQLSIKIDANGNGHVYVGDSQMNGDVFFTHDKSLNTDFNAGGDIDHMISGVNAGLPNQLLIGVEDLKGGGDRDYNDVVFSVNLGGTVDQTSQVAAIQPVADFSDIDSDTLSKTVIHTTGFQAGDVLNVPASSLFNVTVVHTTADYTITIVGKTGNETVDQYEDFANSISFSAGSQTEGARHIEYTVTDSGGLTSTPATADIGVGTSYELSTSQLGHGQTTLGSGDDLLHINTDSFGPVRMGDGDDTVHLAQWDRSFDHQDAIKLENVEAIDTAGYGTNTVSLSIHDVLGMTDSDNHLTIIGDKGDTVTLTGSGNNHWTVADSNAEFTTYIYNDPSHQAVVEISNQLNTQVS